MQVRHRPVWKRRHTALLSGLVLVLLVLLPDLWIAGTPYAAPQTLTAPQWIVVPGASVRRDGSLSPVLEERMKAALHASQDWPNARILVSGTAIPGGYDEPLAMAKWLYKQGVPRSRVVLDRQGRDTRATLLQLGKPHGSLVIATQAWHLPRSLWLARKYGWTAHAATAGTPQLAWWQHPVREHLVRAVYFWSECLR